MGWGRVGVGVEKGLGGVGWGRVGLGWDGGRVESVGLGRVPLVQL